VSSASTRPVTAYVLATVKSGKEYDIAEKVMKYRGVKKVTITYGMWDMVIEIEADSREEVGRVVTKIRDDLKDEGLETTLTLLGV